MQHQKQDIIDQGELRLVFCKSNIGSAAGLEISHEIAYISLTTEGKTWRYLSQ